MRLRRTTLLLLPAVLWVGCSRAEPAAAPGKPVRIVSLTLATDEVLIELVPAERMAAVSSFADREMSNVAGKWPAHIPRLAAEMERTLAARPDLVCVASYTQADVLEQLRRNKLTVFRWGFGGLDAVEEHIRLLGKAVGEPESAGALADRMAARRKALAERLAGAARPRVLYLHHGSTAGTGTTYDDIIREAGGVNMASELGLDWYRPMSDERILACDPDVLLLEQDTDGDPVAEAAADRVLGKLRAVREGRVIAIPQRRLSSVSHHVMDGVEQLAKRLHPDKF